ncbi:class I SAM-dependent methyltransferase [Herbivorax sp. ANBcel31]|uniref:tRNA (adenine(22)-N(1))-methyltransferase n=1 Tax=Herbivorax sp. ANBcel31 TaxID=3069754 RepID=UPI0027B32BC1|nr:class I SAM-dependent methyltransferase [Herbivorax sp. ANBcel31]MDQ2087239.1 class I SAM-dependent methyltransferase [Herbivorax sp. ANBcel31]
MELSGRLKLIAQMVPECNIVCDIGTDHAYIPVYLINNKKCEKAIASDVRLGPIHIAKRNIGEYNLLDSIETRVGDGLDSIKENETDVIIIAGMGGLIIKEILERGKSKAKKARALIIQPMYAIEVVHEWLCDNGFEVYDEELTKEGYKIYDVINAKWTGKIKRKDNLYYHIGEKLFEKKDPLLKTHIENKIRQLDKIINEMENMKQRDSIKRKECIILKEKYKKARELV